MEERLNRDASYREELVRYCCAHARFGMGQRGLTPEAAVGWFPGIAALGLQEEVLNVIREEARNNNAQH